MSSTHQAALNTVIWENFIVKIFS